MMKCLFLGLLAGILAGLLAFFSINPLVICSASFILIASVSYFVLNRESTPIEAASNEGHRKLNSPTAANNISKASSHIAIGGASISFFLEQLSKAFNEQVSNIGEMSNRLQQLEGNSAQLDSLAKSATVAMNESDEKTQLGSKSVKEVLKQQQQLVKNISASSEALSVLKARAEGISNITNTINQLADQTNMLALNAAIEAARAGDQGRGFAVVADEVRELAKKTTDATSGIENLLQEMNNSSVKAVSTMEAVLTSSEGMNTLLIESEEAINQSSTLSTHAREAMNEMESMVEHNTEHSTGMSSNVLQLHTTTSKLELF